MSDPFRLTWGVRHADGRETRWAADETDPAKQPQGFTFDTTNPGGFGKFGLTLSRDLIPQDDEGLLDSLIAWGPGGEIVFEGRITRFPRSQGDSKQVTVEGIGWSSHLGDFRAFREIYRDALASNWLNGPSNLRRKNLLENARYILEGQAEAVIDPPVDGVVDPNDLFPCVKQTLTSINGGDSSGIYGGATDCRTCNETWYDAGAIPIGSVWYDVETGQASGGSMASSGWRLLLILSDDHVHTNYQATSDLDGGGTGTLTASGATKRWATLQFVYLTGDNGVSSEWHADWHLAVYGAHGLTKRGTEPAAGFYAKDIIADVIQRAAPLLRIGTMEDSGFVIQQAAYRDATTAAQVVLESNKTQQYDWFIWEDRTFSILNPDPERLCWRARVNSEPTGAALDGKSGSAEITAEGEDAVKLASGIYVYYEDQWGQKRVYGPTGATDCTATDDRLVGDGSDPYSKHGIAGPMTVTLDSACTDDIALELGAVLLAENNAAARSGTIKLQGYVEHPTEGLVPSWRVRAGDYIQIVDLPGDTPRKIVQTTYNHANREVTCTVANGALYRADALLARIAMSLGLLG